MDKAWQKYLDMASGLTKITQKRAEQVVRSLVKQGEVATDRAEKTVDELLSRSEANRKAAAQIVRSEVDKAVERLGLVRQRDLRALERRIDELERRGPASTPATKKSAKRSSAKKSAKSAPAKKSSAAKRAARTTAAKKSAARAQPAKKTAPPSSPASETP